MKFCLNSHVAPIYQNAADQIKVPFKDMAILPKLNQEKEIILYIPHLLSKEEFAEIKHYQKILKDNLILAFPYYPTPELRDGCRYYTSYPVESLAEAKALIANGSEYIKVGGSLFFQVDELQALERPVRLTPNRANLSVVPRENGICGQWIRPEDLGLYDVLEGAVVDFDLCMPSEEEALFRIYSEQKSWPGSLDYIIRDINSGDVLNRLIEDGVGEHRLNCRQRCMNRANVCRICPNAFKLAKLVEEKYHEH